MALDFKAAVHIAARIFTDHDQTSVRWITPQRRIVAAAAIRRSPGKRNPELRSAHVWSTISWGAGPPEWPLISPVYADWLRT